MARVAGTLYWKPGCTTCRRAKALLDALGAELATRDIDRAPLSENEIGALMGDRPLAPFLNTRTALYRERDMKARPPSRAEAIRLIAADSNLLRRPLLVTSRGDTVHGLDEERYRELFER